LTTLFAFLFMGLSVAVQDTVPPIMDVDPDTINGVIDPGALQEEMEEAETDTIIPVSIWEYLPSTGYEVNETDSTLRWVNMLNMTDRFAKRPGGISYRTGILSRVDGTDFHTFENRHFRAEMNDLNINDPLTGGINWYRVPVHKIKVLEESDFGAIHRTRIRLRDHYLTQPRTYLNFDESSENYRSLEFVATHNVSQKTNLEISFWDRRDGIGYQRSEIEGRQIFLQGYRQLSDTWLLRGGYINNRAEQQQSFGYQVTDPDFFAFNPFTETPLQNNAGSKEKTKDVFLHLHHRGDKDSPIRSSFGFNYQTDERTIQYTAEGDIDSIGTKFRNYELYGNQRLHAGNLEAELTARTFLLHETLGNQLTEDFWAGGELNTDLLLQLNRNLFLSGNARTMVRNDGRRSTEASARADLILFDRWVLSGFAGYGDLAPDLQALYWESNEFSGNPNLNNEENLTIGAQSVIGFLRYFNFGVRADARDVNNGIFLDPQGTFTNIDNYRQLSGTGWLGLESSLFEGQISATYKTFETGQSLNQVNVNMANSPERLWLKGNFYLKNYFFDRATFVKMGVNGIFSPQYYRTAEYITPLNRWQHGGDQALNPPFNRLDFEVSARIRWFMMLLKWENLLDGVTQRGYFETMGYPMPERRFIFSIRVLFTN